MYKIKDIINTIICGNAKEELQKIPSESINCVITSPPYWALRDYHLKPQIWDGDPNCKHKWQILPPVGDLRFRPGYNSLVGNQKKSAIYPIKHRPKETNPGKESWYKDRGGLSSIPEQSNFCSKCGAWRGSLGLEPTFDLYIKHLCDIFDEVKRVLRKDGACFVNIGDTYSTVSGNQGKGLKYGGMPKFSDEAFESMPEKSKTKLPDKSLCLIPSRFSIEMVNRGWILRNTIIWYKRNCMPSSTKDRFTIDFEYVFFFVKSNDPQYWVNIKTGQTSKKQPLGLKGIEGIDWDWKEVQDWKQEETEGYNMGSVDPHRAALMGGLQLGAKHKKQKGKLKKVSNWQARDYWFEQQFEQYDKPLDRWGGDRLKADGKSLWDKGTGQETYRDRDMRPNPQGRNRRCVWDIPTKPSKGSSHFATFPEALIKPIILSGCPEFVCNECGQPREKIYKKGKLISSGPNKMAIKPRGFAQNDMIIQDLPKDPYGDMPRREQKFIGYTDCGCNAGFSGGIVVDTFIGMGTTGIVAKKFNRKFIGIDIKPEYCKKAEKKILNTTGSLF